MLRDPLPRRRKLSPRSQPDLPKQISLLLFQSCLALRSQPCPAPGAGRDTAILGMLHWGGQASFPTSRVLRGLGASRASATADLGA